MNAFSKPPAAAEPVRLSEESDFSLGDLLVHPSLREVLWGGQKEQIEPRIMQVLVALVNAAGVVVSRDELIERCWEGRIVGEAAINRCISKLRELSESSGPRSFTIETIPRVGYRLMSAEAAGITGKTAAAASTSHEQTLHTPRVFLWIILTAA